MVNNINSLKAIGVNTHMQISAYCSRLYGDTGVTVRKMLSAKSFDEQLEFGLEVLKRFGG